MQLPVLEPLDHFLLLASRPDHPHPARNCLPLPPLFVYP